MPSASEVVAANPPPLGGLDFVIETFVPPALVMVNDFVAVVPTATSPNSFFSLVIFSTPGGPALPDTGTVPLPPVVSMPNSSWKVPSEVGWKVTVTVTDLPGSISLPTAGMPLTENGAAGSFSELIFSGALPTLLNVAELDDSLPTVTPPKATMLGLV